MYKRHRPSTYSVGITGLIRIIGVLHAGRGRAPVAMPWLIGDPSPSRPVGGSHEPAPLRLHVATLPCMGCCYQVAVNAVYVLMFLSYLSTVSCFINCSLTQDTAVCPVSVGSLVICTADGDLFCVRVEGTGRPRLGAHRRLPAVPRVALQHRDRLAHRESSITNADVRLPAQRFVRLVLSFLLRLAARRCVLRYLVTLGTALPLISDREVRLGHRIGAVVCRVAGNCVARESARAASIERRCDIAQGSAVTGVQSSKRARYTDAWRRQLLAAEHLPS